MLRSDRTGRTPDQTYTLHTRNGDIVIVLFREGWRSRIVVYRPSSDPAVKKCWTFWSDKRLARTIAAVKVEVA